MPGVCDPECVGLRDPDVERELGRFLEVMRTSTFSINAHQAHYRQTNSRGPVYCPVHDAEPPCGPSSCFGGRGRSKDGDEARVYGLGCALVSASDDP